MRVLVVEDNERMARRLVKALHQHGYEVRWVVTAAEALRADPGRTADVVLLDLGLPDMDGIEICRRLREVDGVAVIAVTARGEEADRVLGLRSGADDYMVKPFGISELLARMEAVARRTRPARTARVDETEHRVGPLVVHPGSRTASCAGKPLQLTRKEFDLLEVLAAKPGQVCSRDHLIDQVWHTTWEGPTRTLDVHIAALRAKLDDTGRIETVRGVGYRLRE